MCGIVGYTGTRQAAPFLLHGLETLEYRGYDSSGMALQEPLAAAGAPAAEASDDAGREWPLVALSQLKCKGRVAALAGMVEAFNPQSTCGIAHTRWATHGEPSDVNAHPHFDCHNHIAVVHNGIIENYLALKEELEHEGHCFKSQTDSEVIAHLLERELELHPELDVLQVLPYALARLEGTWALAITTVWEPGTIVCARKGSPLVLATTEDGCYLASDITALAGVTSEVINLDDGQLARLRAGETPACEVFSADAIPVTEPDVLVIDWDASAATMGGYPDFMAKEIAEQPAALTRLLEGRLGPEGIILDELALSEEEIAAIDRIFIVACGTSYHVGLVARTWCERWAKIPVTVAPASEFSYENVLVTPHTLCIIITQSGETADTLASARKMHAAGARVLAITNVLGSSAAREADAVLYIKAGPEVSVASTKAYTAQLAAAALVALFLAQHTGVMGPREVARRFHELERVPALIEQVLARAWQDEAACPVFASATSSLFLGRGLNATTAAEGALKMKEISYLHAEGYPAGEMKHGPIALLEPGFPVVVVAPDDAMRDKCVSAMQECRARGASIVAVATDGDRTVAQLADYVLRIPPTPEAFTPLVAIVPLQLLARYVALARGCDIDKPRNLAKSVTVE
jgi:glucosamine--fructose-6-phosphate aminotransferase (isomerizing)